MTTYKIQDCINGWLCTKEYGIDTEETVVGVEEGADETDCFIEFLRDVAYAFGPTDSKHSKKRIYIMGVPGSDYYSQLEKETLQELIEKRDMLTDIINYQRGNNGEIEDSKGSD